MWPHHARAVHHGHAAGRGQGSDPTGMSVVDCKVPVVCSKSCIERTMQRLDNARQQVGVTKQQGAARCIELTEAVEVHLGVVANSKMANVAVIRSKFGFICIGNARICSECCAPSLSVWEGDFSTDQHLKRLMGLNTLGLVAICPAGL